MSSSISSAIANLQDLRAQLFKQSDTDKNGTLGLNEFKQMSSAMSASGMQALGEKGQTAEQVFKALDKDGNGQLTQAEMEQGAKLADQITSLMLQLQDIQSGSTMASMLGGNSSDTDLASIFTNLNSSANSLTALLSKSTSDESSTSILAALLKGEKDGNTSGADSMLSGFIQQILSNYKSTETAAAEATTTTGTTTAVTA